MSTNINKTECYNKIMNQSIQSKDLTENSNHKKMRLRSNTIFAFQDDHIYFNLVTDEDEEQHRMNSNDTYLIPHNSNLNNSNFFSTVCDRSQWLNLNNTTTEKNHENENDLDSLGSIADEMEKDFRFLNEVEDDLNDAKLSLNEENSLSSTTINNQHYNMNMTTPVNMKKQLESEEFRTINTNLNTGHSFSSFLTNMNNGTSNGSSFFITPDDKKQITSTKSNKFITSGNFPNQFMSNYDPDYRNFLTPRNFLSTNPYAYSFTSLNSLASDNNQYPTTCNDPIQKCNISNVSNLSGVTPPLNTLNYSHHPSKSHVQMQIPLPIQRPIKFNPNEDKSVLDNLLILIKDQNGCRMIQKKLEEKREEFIFKFFDKIKGNINEIICDQFGNYVIQKFVECCTEKSIITSLLEKIKPKIFSVSTNCYGTRGFQRILDFLSEDADYEILKEYLSNNIFNLIKDVNGNHVIQKIIQIYPVNKNNFIFEEIIQNIIEISKLKQGSCIFQKMIDKASDRNKAILLEKIILNIDKLINDEHGNFIIQHTVNLKIEEYNIRIFEYVKINFIALSKQKYSSNVIDKCILYEDSLSKGELVERMLELKCVGELILDQYGNYGKTNYINLVVQKALQVTNGIKFLEIIESIKKTIKCLKQTNHGKKIYDNLMSNYGEYFNVPKQVLKKSTTMNTKVVIVKKDKNFYSSMTSQK